MSKIRPELIDELLKDYQKPEDVIGDEGLLKQLIKAILERALETELTHQSGCESIPAQKIPPVIHSTAGVLRH